MLEIYNSYPWLIKETINLNFVYSKWPSFTAFIKECINMDYYVLVYVNTFYIKEYDTYNQTHRHHPVLIYGYDDEDNTFSIADFFTQKGYYFATTTYQEIENSKIDASTENLFMGVFLFKQNTRHYRQDFSIQCVIPLLEDYLNSRDSNIRNMIYGSPSLENGEYTFGLNIYNVLIDHLRRDIYIENSTITVLVDHKTIMKELIKYLHRKGYIHKINYIYSQYEEIYSETRLIRSLIIKRRFIDGDEITQRIIAKFNDLKTKEKHAIQHLIRLIRPTPSLPFICDTNSITTVILLNQDTNTNGNWQSTYGTQGYILPWVDPVVPTWAQYLLADADVDTNEIITSNENLLQIPDKTEQRSVGSFSRNKHFDIHIINSESRAHKISLYFLDANKEGYTNGTVQLINGQTGNIIHTHDITNVDHGVYYTYQLSGYIIFRIRFECYYQRFYSDRVFGEIFGLFFD